jgi:hypothetical protein
VEAWQDEFAVTAKLFRQMQLFLEVLNEVLEFRQIFRRRFDQALVSFQHRLCPSGAVFFFQRYWKELARPLLWRSHERLKAGATPS